MDLCFDSFVGYNINNFTYEYPAEDYVIPLLLSAYIDGNPILPPSVMHECENPKKCPLCETSDILLATLFPLIAGIIDTNRILNAINIDLKRRLNNEIGFELTSDLERISWGSLHTMSGDSGELIDWMRMLAKSPPTSITFSTSLAGLAKIAI